MEGYLDKQGFITGNKRYFRLIDGVLSYSDTPATDVKGVVTLRLASSVVYEDAYRRITIRGEKLNRLKKANKTEYVLVAPTSQEYCRWRGAIRKARAFSPATHISWSESFSRLVEGFRGCVKEAAEASILDLSEYSEGDFRTLQGRHAEHEDTINRTRAHRRQNSASTSNLSTPPASLAATSSGAPGVLSDEAIFESLGSSNAADSSGRRPLNLPRRNPLPLGTGNESDVLDTFLSGSARDGFDDPPARPLAASSTSEAGAGPLLNIPMRPIVPPPRTSAHSHDAPAGALAARSGPAWHYLDVLNHAGGLLSSVSYIASEAELREFWEMYATAQPGYLLENEHRDILQHLVDEVKASLPKMLGDIVATVLRAYGFDKSEARSQDLMTKSHATVAGVVERFYTSLLSEMDSLAADMWSVLDNKGSGRVARKRFLEVYSSRPILPTSSLLDVTLDEVGSQIQRHVAQHAPRNGRGSCGLDNLGNTCYFNSAVQCIARSPLLQQHLLLERHKRSDGKATPVCDALSALLRAMFDGAKPSLAPTELRSAVNARTGDFFAGIEQHDSQELLMALLDALHEEMNCGRRGSYRELPDKPTKPDAALAAEWWEAHCAANESVICDWFHGQTKCATTCGDCGSVSLNFDPCVFVTVPIPGGATNTVSEPVRHRPPAQPPRATVDPLGPGPRFRQVDDDSDPDDFLASDDTDEDGGEQWLEVLAEDSPPRRTPPQNTTLQAVDLETCLAAYFREEALSGHDAVYCSSCKRHCTGRKRTTLWRLPYYLIITLKRFKHDKSGQLLSKNSTPVRVPSRLDMRRFLDPGSTGGPLASGETAPSAKAAASSPLYAASRASSGQTSGVSTPRYAHAEPAAGGPQPSTEYEAYGIVRHSGWISGGHYMASCKSDGQWCLYNDSMVSAEVDPLGAPDASVYTVMYRLRRPMN